MATQDLVKDLITTVENKVTKGLAGTQGALTQGLVDTPGQVRSALNTEGPAVSNAQLFNAIGQRTSPLLGGITASSALLSSSTDVLSNFLTGLTNLAQTASSQRSASRPSLQLKETARGLRAFNPLTGQFEGDVLGQSPQSEDEFLDAVFQDLRNQINSGTTNVGELARTFPELSIEQIQSEVDAARPPGPLSGLVNFFQNLF